jgi:hypothetical protein
VYIDDFLLFAKLDEVLDSVISSLHSEFNLTLKGDVGAFLDVDIQRNADGFLELVQTGLITKIISLCGLENELNQHKTPSTDILCADSSGPE